MKKIVKLVHTHIQVLHPVRKSYDVLKTVHVNYQAISRHCITIQTLHQITKNVGALVTKQVPQRVMKSKKVPARTLTNQKQCIERVKKVDETVSETIITSEQCVETHHPCQPCGC